MNSAKRKSLFLVFRNFDVSALILFFFFTLFVSTAACAESLSASKTIETSIVPNGISPALNILIIQKLLQRQYDDALKYIDNELVKDPQNVDLLYKKASIYADTDQYRQSLNIVNQVLVLQPHNLKAKRLQSKLEKLLEAEPHNELGFDQGESYVSDLQSYWSDSSLHYYRLSNTGKFGGRINFARRFGTTGKQFQLEAYPELFPGANAALTVAYANTTQYLYANLQYTIEGYFSLPHHFDFSLGQYGQEYIRFGHKKIFTYTGSLGKSIGSYYLWFRPSYYTPVSTEYYSVGIRRYFSDANNFLTFQIGTGRLPDIGDLPPLDQLIIIDQTAASLSLQTSMTKTVFGKLGAGYFHQKLPSGTIRNITMGSIGIVWMF